MRYRVLGAFLGIVWGVAWGGAFWGVSFGVSFGSLGHLFKLFLRIMGVSQAMINSYIIVIDWDSIRHSWKFPFCLATCT